MVKTLKHQRNSTKNHKAEEENRSHGQALGWKICKPELERPRDRTYVISDIQELEEHPRHSPVSGYICKTTINQYQDVQETKITRERQPMLLLLMRVRVNI